VKTTRRVFLSQAGAGAVVIVVPGIAAAAYPDRPVKVIMPYPAGGAADTFARIVTVKLEKILGQPVVLDYKPGGTGTIAAEATARASADGYTLHVIDSGAFAYVPNMRKLNYDPLKSLTPVAPLGVVPMIVVAHPSLPARDIRELVAYAKANPGKLNCASAGVGSAHHLIAEFFKIRAGIQMNHVPYRGAAQYMTDLVGGQVDLAVSTLAPAIPYVQTGRIRALGLTTLKRSSAVPEVPTIAEQGFAGFDEKPWICFVGPAGIPPEVLEHLRAAFRKVYEDPEVVPALNKAGLEDVGAMSPSEMAEQMKVDLAKWGEVIRQAKITLDS
jgi:tripartite-type tricarboxylate transporter receptor subunit TctC